MNGVAELHTNIIKNDLFRDFYEIYPERFNNKTNGITQRRWLKLANPLLSNLITETIGDKWITDLNELKKLEDYADDAQFQEKWQEIKYKNKKHLSRCIHKHLEIELNPEALYVSQIKRIHEYKRQLMNALYIITLYNRLKSDKKYKMPARTVIFAGKAAPAYATAKLIIKLINSIAKVVNNDQRSLYAQLLRKSGRTGHSGNGFIRTDFHCWYGSIRNRQHETFIERCSYDRNT